MSRRSSNESISSLDDISFLIDNKPSTPSTPQERPHIQIIDPIVQPSELSSLRVELGSTTKVVSPTLIVPEDVYNKDFYPNSKWCTYLFILFQVFNFVSFGISLFQASPIWQLWMISYIGHYNFIGYSTSGVETEREYIVFSVRATPTEGFYRGVKNTKKVRFAKKFYIRAFFWSSSTITTK